MGFYPDCRETKDGFQEWVWLELILEVSLTIVWIIEVNNIGVKGASYEAVMLMWMRKCGLGWDKLALLQDGSGFEAVKCVASAGVGD